MERVNNLQMSLFGNFINIKPKTDVVIKLLTALKDEQFIPGSADIATVDIKTGKVMVDSRMQLISPDKTWSICFLDERIDFNYIYQENTTVYRNAKKVIEIGKQLIQKVFGVFTDTTGNRLAINGRFILDDLSDPEIKNFCQRFTKSLGVFKDDTYAEWGVRYNSRTNMSFSEYSEMCNRIIEMSQVERADLSAASVKLMHDILISFDVNTAQVSTESKYKYYDLLAFVDNSSDFITNVINEIGD